MMCQILFGAIVIKMLLQFSSGCGHLVATSYYDGDTAVGQIKFYPAYEVDQYMLMSSGAKIILMVHLFMGTDTFTTSSDSRIRVVNKTIIITGMEKSDEGKYHIQCHQNFEPGDRTDEVELLLPIRCGNLQANSFYRGNTAFGEITFYPDPELQVSFHRPEKDNVSYSILKKNNTHSIFFKNSTDEHVIESDKRFIKINDTVVIRGMKKTDAGRYYVTCSFTGRDGQTKEAELLFPEQSFAGNLSNIGPNTSLSTATVALIVGLGTLFIVQVVVMAVFCYRRRIKSRQTQQQSDVSGKSNEVFRGPVPRLPEGINAFERRRENISIDSQYDIIPIESTYQKIPIVSHYEKIPHDIKNEDYLHVIPTMPERRDSSQSTERRSSSPNHYLELAEVIDCHVRKTIHYVHNQGKFQSNSERPQFKPRVINGTYMTMFDDNRQNNHKSDIKEDPSGYLDMESFERGCDIKSSDTNYYVYSDNKAHRIDVSDNFGNVVFRKQPCRNQVKNNIAIDSDQFNVLDADEVKQDLLVGGVYCPENQDVTRKGGYDEEVAKLDDPVFLKYAILKHTEEENQGQVDQDGEETYLGINSSRDYGLVDSHLDNCQHEDSSGLNDGEEEFLDDVQAIENKSQLKFDSDVEYPNNAIEQSSRVSDGPTDICQKAEDNDYLHFRPRFDNI